MLEVIFVPMYNFRNRPLFVDEGSEYSTYEEALASAAPSEFERIATKCGVPSEDVFVVIEKRYRLPRR